MPEKINLTKAIIAQLPAPDDGKRALYYDAMCRGLCLRVTPSGTKALYFYRKVKGKPVMKCIGPFPDPTIEQARRKIDEINGAVALGEDIEPKTKDPTIDHVFIGYLDNHATTRKVNWNEDLDKYDRHIKKAFGTRRASDITRDLSAASTLRTGTWRSSGRCSTRPSSSVPRSAQR